MKVNIKREVKYNKNVETVLITFKKFDVAKCFEDKLEEKGYRLIDGYYKYDKPTVTVVNTLDIELVEFKHIIENELEEFLK